MGCRSRRQVQNKDSANIIQEEANGRPESEKLQEMEMELKLRMYLSLRERCVSLRHSTEGKGNEVKDHLVKPGSEGGWGLI